MARSTELTVRNASRSGTWSDAKSILAAMGLGAPAGHQVVLTIDGVEEDAAIAALTELVAAGIGQPEA